MKYNLNEEFTFNRELMRKLNIPILNLNRDDNIEIWKFVNLDRHKKLTNQQRYMVSNYARVYDRFMKRIIIPYRKNTNAKGEYYLEIRLRQDDIAVRYTLHRLVALAFIPIDPERPFVNHIDGHPSNNKLWNLEWVTNSENVLHAIQTGLRVDQRGEERPNAIWTDDEVRFICSLMEEGHKATYIYQVLGDVLQDPKVQYERVRTLYKHIIRKTHWTHISKDYNIDFTRFNYSKEKGSVEKSKLRMQNELSSSTIDS